MEFSLPQLQIAIQAVRDAADLAQARIDRGEGDVGDWEHYLYSLSTLEAELKSEYLKHSAKDPSILTYDVLIGARRFRKL